MQNQVFDLLTEAGRHHGFTVCNLTGSSFDDSLARARGQRGQYSHLVVVGGDGMIALGANATGGTDTPLGVVAIGSGNDFARGLGLPVNRVSTAVDGIVSAIVHGSHLDVDMGLITPLPQSNSGTALRAGTDVAETPVEPRCYAGMLSCGIDASINDRANHSRLPNGSIRYLAAVLVELTRIKQYGYHIRAVLADGTVTERDLITPLLTVANSRHIGGGIEVSPYSRFDDGLLDLVWLDHVPSVGEIARVIPHLYDGRLLASSLFGWHRVREVEITRAAEGAEPPTLMADGEYVGHLPVRVTAQPKSLRVLAPPAAVRWYRDRTEERVERAMLRDGRDPLTGKLQQ